MDLGHFGAVNSNLGRKRVKVGEWERGCYKVTRKRVGAFAESGVTCMRMFCHHQLVCVEEAITLERIRDRQ